MFEYQLTGFKRKACVVPLFFLLALQVKVTHAEQFFPMALLAEGVDSEIADLSIFEHGDAQMPGVYEVSIWLGDEKIATKKIKFIQDKQASPRKDTSDTEESESDLSEEVATEKYGIAVANHTADTIINVAENDHVVNINEQMNDENHSVSSEDEQIDKNPEELLNVDNVRSSDNTGLVACFLPKDLIEFGINPSTIPSFDQLKEDECIDLRELISNAFSHFDFQKMVLTLSIPQVNLNTRYKGWIPPERWDDGITAGLLNYNMNFSDSRGDFSSQSGYLGLNAGLNIGPWRIRDNSSFLFNTSNTGKMVSEWQHLQTYAERSIPKIKSSLVLGETSSNSLVFDSLPFLGVELSSNENMYPSVMRGYAPVVRGYAESNAKVIVRQNGHIIHQINVSPGEFVIDNLFSVSSNGDLEVTVEEFEGKKRTFTVPYASNPTLLREGRLKYNVTAGRFNGGSHYEDPLFIQAGFVRGFPLFTVFGGTQAAEDYLSLRIGAGFNLGHWGAMSTDVTQARSTLMDGSSYDGYSLGLLYARSFLSGTNIQIAGYRYSSEGFYQLQDTARKDIIVNDLDDENNPLEDSFYNLDTHRRQRFHANIAQKLGRFGSVYLSGVQESYWNSPKVNQTFRLGYGGTHHQLRYNLNYDLSRNSETDKNDQSLLLSLSLPLGGKKKNTNISYSSRLTDMGAMHNLSVSGQRLDNHMGWGLTGSLSESGNASFNGHTNYTGAYGNSSAGLSVSNGNYQSSLSTSGGLIVHSDGITFGKSLGSANILVAAPNVKHVPILEGQGAKTDWHGYGIKSFANEFNANNVGLDIEKVSSNVEIEKNIVEVIPTKGAVVRAKFEAKIGLRALLTLIHKGKPLPFGTTVIVDGQTSMVGEDGEVYLTGLEKIGKITAKWGNSEDKQCQFEYEFSEEDGKDQVVQRQYECS